MHQFTDCMALVSVIEEEGQPPGPGLGMLPSKKWGDDIVVSRGVWGHAAPTSRNFVALMIFVL